MGESRLRLELALRPQQAAPDRSLRSLVLACLFLAVVCGTSLAGPPGSIAGTVRTLGANGQPAQGGGPVVVFVEDVEQGFPAPAALEMRQHDKQFHPRLLLVPVGSTVAFPNDDGVDHNVFSLSPVNAFDLGYYRAGTSRTVRFDKPGAVRIYCNIHPSMIADILVLSNPYYALAGSDGRFRIDGVPPGQHRLRAWFPLGPSQGRPVDVPPGGTVEAQLQLEATVVTRAHDNKHGEPYLLDYQR